MKRFSKKVILKQLRKDIREFLGRKLSPDKVVKKPWIWDLIK